MPRNSKHGATLGISVYVDAKQSLYTCVLLILQEESRFGGVHVHVPSYHGVNCLEVQSTDDHGMTEEKVS